METFDAFLFHAGFCVHPEFSVIRGGRRAAREFPAMVLVLRHPRHGVILVDTGYAPRFFEVTRHLPWKLYALLTPVTIPEGDSAVSTLARVGIAPAEVTTIIVTHFHADHIGGLRDFPAARFIWLDAAWRGVESLTGLAALRAGFLRGLLPDDFAARSRAIPSAALAPLAELDGLFSGADVFGDGSMKLVALPGHAVGMAGVLFTTSTGRRIFHVVDAVWLKRSLDENRPPPWFAGLVMDDARAFRDTFARLRTLQAAQPDLTLLITHCFESHVALPGIDTAGPASPSH